MDDRIRISDADRDRVTARLRDHFAAGRLTPEELDERITAALSARTVGDLREVMADLPEPAPAVTGSPHEQRYPPRAPAPWRIRRGRPGILPLVVLALLAALVLSGGGWLLLTFLTMIAAFWLAVCVAGLVLAAGLRRRARRDWWSGPSGYACHEWRGAYRRDLRRYSRL